MVVLARLRVPHAHEGAASALLTPSKVEAPLNETRLQLAVDLNGLFGQELEVDVRQERVRERMGMTGPDPLAVALDEKLGVVQRDGLLYLEPDKATLRPAK